MKTELIFKRCREYNTEQCPNLNNEEMQLSIIDAPYFIFLNNNTTDKLRRICEECPAFEPTWRAIDKHS